MTKYQLFITHRERILDLIEMGASTGQICHMINQMYNEIDHKHQIEMTNIEDIHKELMTDVITLSDKWKHKFILETLEPRNS